MRFEYILSKVGHCGRWQVLTFGLTCLVNLIINLQNVSSVFLTLKPDHRCAIPGLEDPANLSAAALNFNWTLERAKSFALPRFTGGHYSSCLMRNRNYDVVFQEPWTLDVEKESIMETDSFVVCDSWTFRDSSHRPSSIVSEWSLVCNFEVYRIYAKHSFLFGIILGSLFWGFISDRCGRRPTALAGLIIVVVAGIMTPFSFHYTNFIVLRVLVGLGCQAVTSSYYLLLSETVTYRCRSVFQLGFLSMMPLASMVMPSMASIAHSWYILSLSIALCSLMLVVTHWVIPESPRWLVVKGRLRESCQVLQRIAKVNGETVDEDELLNMLSDCHRTKMHSYDIAENRTVWWLFVNLFQQEMVKTTIICAILWMATCSSLCILMSGSVTSLAWESNLSQNTFYTGFLDLPNYMIAVVIAKHIGRKVGVITLLATQGIFTFSLASVSKDSWFYVDKVLSVLSRGLVGTAMCTIYVFTVELFATRHRHLGFGICSFCGRLGHMSTLYILPLLVGYSRSITLTLCGIQSLLVAVLCILLQETKNKFLPDTLEDVKVFNVLDENHLNRLPVDRNISAP